MADLTTMSDLYGAAAAGGEYTIAAGTYTLTEAGALPGNLTIAKDLTLTPVDGNVVIDGADAYHVIVNDNGASTTTHEIGDGDGVNTVQITQGNTDCVVVDNNAAALTLNCHSCEFDNAAAGDGLSALASPAGDVAITCSDCDCHDNAKDGFSLESGTVDHFMVLNLVNTDSYNHTSAEPADGDGVTAHKPKQIVNVSGGTFHNNAKGAMSIVEGSDLWCSGATFYNNANRGTLGPPLALMDAHIFVGKGSLPRAGSGYVENCTFYGEDGYTPSKYDVRGYRCHSFVVTGCHFHDSEAYYYAVDMYDIDAGFLLQNLFQDMIGYRSPANFYMGAMYAGAGLIAHNTLHNCTRGFYLYSQGQTVRNNIFSSVGSYAIRLAAAATMTYKHHGENGRNAFHNCGAPVFYDDATASTAAQYRDTDLQATDPLFADAAGGDFRLRIGSPCVNAVAGNPALTDDYRHIGAWQPKHRLLRPRIGGMG